MARSRTPKIKLKTNEFVAYYRVSTVKQGESGLGLEAQQASVAAYVARVKGVLIAGYIEVESGKKDNRPKLAAALQHAERIGAALVIAKLDRLARRVSFISSLMESGVEFVACDMPEANRLTLHVMAAFAEHEARAISTRTKEAMAAAKARGVKLGNPNFLEVLKLGRAARHPVPANTLIDRMVRERSAAGLSLRAIAAELNAADIKTPTGARWHPSTVREALLRVTEQAA